MPSLDGAGEGREDPVADRRVEPRRRGEAEASPHMSSRCASRFFSGTSHGFTFPASYCRDMQVIESTWECAIVFSKCKFFRKAMGSREGIYGIWHLLNRAGIGRRNEAFKFSAEPYGSSREIIGWEVY